MSRLAIQQQAMLAMLFDRPSKNAIENIADYAYPIGARGLKVYQANGYAVARAGLLAAYSVLAQLLGAQSFEALAHAFWHAQPPLRGDVAQWGGGLPAFVRDSAQLQDEPYLCDMARLEWALHCAASAADASVDAASFALLATHNLAALHLRLAAGCAVVDSAWPIASIHAAHVGQDVSFAQVRQRLQAQVAECALVWRPGLRCQVRQVEAVEHTLLSALLAGRSLGQALEEVAQRPETPEATAPWDISTWLSEAVQSGLLLGVFMTTPDPESPA
jgi:hypothetical protein